MWSILHSTTLLAADTAAATKPLLHPFLIVGIGITVVLTLILKWRVNAFIALITAALVVSFLAPAPPTTDDPAKQETWVSRVAKEFGTSCEKIGLVIGFAAVIGEAMMKSRAADRIVLAFLKLLGAKRASLALMSSGFVLGIPVFFDTVFYLLVPLANSLYRSTRKNYLLYICAIAAGGAVTHTLVPPTPGPAAMAANLGVPLGMMIVVGLLVAAPSACVAMLVAVYMDRKVQLSQLPKLDDESFLDPEVAARREKEIMQVPILEAILPVLLPVVLITADTIVTAMMPKGQPSFWATLKPFTASLGDPDLALLISMTASIITWIRLRSPGAKDVAEACEAALLSGGLIILITAAGGSFGAMLKEANIADVIKSSFEGQAASGLLALFLGFGLAVVLKVAQGSSTTAMIVVSSMMAAMGLTEDKLGFNPVYLATAIGGGSLVGSWMNDSGFWIFARMSGLSDTEALKTWSPLLVVLGSVAFAVTVVLSMVLPLKGW